MHDVLCEEEGVELADKISEEEFIALVNQMVATGDIMQIKDNFSLPYCFSDATYQSLISQNGSTTTSNKSAKMETKREGLRSPLRSDGFISKPNLRSRVAHNTLQVQKLESN